MVLDYAHPRQGILALNGLAEVGVRAVLTPYLTVGDDGDVAATHRIVHRVEVADADRAARSLLDRGVLQRRAD